ncbi:LamG-like jellyroll fold domain-containing protein [Micromonospora sp. NBC_01813]|uniref:LamG-like jellyroll fold domain-containing protein n=1 Tax=Micromonospora sp. NBC_01813 TaxID=2975988 RepID=UPI002DDC6037|nr:LamG-like jellyroll fold domain-containing protein [Micromonospora sp. NBC_01813]WSA08977.1 LamG domain-containing protein [Micromonospora sp. NBC_01813]
MLFGLSRVPGRRAGKSIRWSAATLAVLLGGTVPVVLAAEPGTAAPSTVVAPDTDSATASGPASAATEDNCAAASARTEAAAIAAAGECGHQIEVLDARTEYSQVFADPAGTRTLVSASTPQRVQRDDGSWADVDASLRPTDGMIAPVATLADVRFSAGGAGPFVTWREQDETFTLSWPEPLPAPVLDGDTAVYSDVHPDVDLHVIATVDGFRHALVVNSRTAAADPALREIRYHAGGTMRLERTDDGVLRLVDSTGVFVAESSGARMWDSSADPTAAGEVLPEVTAGRAAAAAKGWTAASSELPAALRSTSAAPGAGANSAEIGVAASSTELVLTPAAGMLDDPDAVLPIFIDPPLNKLRTLWQYASSNNENNDDSNARVGKQPPDQWSSNGQLYRSYFNFSVSAMHGAQILAAEITMELDHSWSCGPTWVHLYRTTAMSGTSGSRLAWSAKPLGSGAVYLDAWAGNANEAGGCGSVQPNADAVFEGQNLVDDLQYYANGNWSNYSVGLCACNSSNEYESTTDRWKQFRTNQTYLIATYDKPPNPPVAQPFSTTTDCYQRCVSPAIVRTTRPVLRANVSDPFDGTGPTIFEVRTAQSDTATVVTDNRPGMTWTALPATAAWQVPAGAFVNGGTYHWRAKSRDENFLWGDWSTWQTLTVDTTPPGISPPTSTDYPQESWGAEVGTAGTFTLTGTSDVADFIWWVGTGPATTVTGTGTGTRTATISHTPTTDMVHTLYARALDLAGNSAGTVEHQFWVSPPPNKYAHWRLDETSGTVAADAGNAQGSALSTGTLAGPASFGPGYLGRALTLAGPGAQMTSNGPVLDTTRSFTVMAWVRASDLTAGSVQTILSQDGDTASRFELQYRADANGGAGGWCFTMRAQETSATPVSACAEGILQALPAEDAWVHLAGAYDPVSGLISAYVMGDTLTCAGETAQASFAGSWAATGSFVIGRGRAAGANTGQWHGAVDDVFAYQRLLSSYEICQQALRPSDPGPS